MIIAPKDKIDAKMETLLIYSPKSTYEKAASVNGRKLMIKNQIVNGRSLTAMLDNTTQTVPRKAFVRSILQFRWKSPSLNKLRPFMCVRTCPVVQMSKHLANAQSIGSIRY